MGLIKWCRLLPKRRGAHGENEVSKRRESLRQLTGTSAFTTSINIVRYFYFPHLTVVRVTVFANASTLSTSTYLFQHGRLNLHILSHIRVNHILFPVEIEVRPGKGQGRHTSPVLYTCCALPF